MTQLELLQAGANSYLDGMEQEGGEVATDEKEHVDINPFPTSSDPRNEINRGIARSEHGSEFIVSWDEPEDEDPENPMNWSSTKKWVNILTISVISFLV